MNELPIVKDAREKMKKGVEFLEHSLRGLRTGRTSPALLDHVKVDAYGSPMPLNQVATVSLPDPRTLVVKPFDPTLLGAIEKAIHKSDIGITPETDGKLIRLHVPMMSQEQRDKMTHRVKDLAEQARVTVRNIRRDQNKAIDDGDLTEDDAKKAKEQIQKITKDAETQIDKIVETRSKEIQEG